MGTGIGCTFQPTLVALQAHTPMSKRAVVISVRNFFRCTGGAVGLAISAAILQSVLKSNLPPGYEYLVHSTYALPARDTIPEADWMGIVDAYVKASHTVFIFQVPLVGVCLLGCFFIRDKGLNKPAEKVRGDVKTEEQGQKDGNESQATIQAGTETPKEIETNDRDIEKQVNEEEDKGDEAAEAPDVPDAAKTEKAENASAV